MRSVPGAERSRSAYVHSRSRRHMRGRYGWACNLPGVTALAATGCRGEYREWGRWFHRMNQLDHGDRRGRGDGLIRRNAAPRRTACKRRGVTGDQLLLVLAWLNMKTAGTALAPPDRGASSSATTAGFECLVTDSTRRWGQLCGPDVTLFRPHGGCVLTRIFQWCQKYILIFECINFNMLVGFRLTIKLYLSLFHLSISSVARLKTCNM